jgi:hypothetical protein
MIPSGEARELRRVKGRRLCYEINCSGIPLIKEIQVNTIGQNDKGTSINKEAWVQKQKQEIINGIDSPTNASGNHKILESGRLI